MRLRYWLNDLFQEEATGAGEGAGGTIADAKHTDAVAGWVAERTGEDAEDTPITTEAPDSEPLVKDIPVETTSTDAVSDDDAALDEGDAAETTGSQDPLLLRMVAAYDYTPEDVVGFDNEGLKRLLARERRKSGFVTPVTEPAKPAAVEAAPVKTEAVSETPKVAPVSASWEEYQASLEEDYSEQGLDDEAIARRLKQEKIRWDREEATQSKVAAMQTRLERQQADYERNLEVESLLNIADTAAEQGLGHVLGRAKSKWTAEQQEARLKFIQAYDVVHAQQPHLSRELAADKALHITFHEEIAKRDAKSLARRVIAQSGQVLGSGTPAKAQQDSSGERNWLKNPKIARVARKHQINNV